MQVVRPILAALMVSTALCAPALGQEVVPPKPEDPNVPKALPTNPNLRSVVFRQDIRVKFIGNPERATVITFAPNEQVKRFVFGDAVSRAEDEAIWTTINQEEVQQAPLRNHLHLWANRVGYTTIQVVTSVDEGTRPDRVYQFAALVRDLPAECKNKPDDFCDDPDATYGLTFVYPDQERQRVAEERRQATETANVQRDERQRQNTFRTARARLAVDHYGGADRNWCWERQGHAEIAPMLNTVSNNQQETTLNYGGRPLPAFSLVKADGKDGDVIMPVMRDGLVVLPIVAPRIRTRLGKDKVLDLINCGQNTIPSSPGTGTISPDVYRVVKTQ